MSQSKLTRRGFAAAAATGVATIGLLGASAKTADAYQRELMALIAKVHDTQPICGAPSRCGHRPELAGFR